MYCCENPDVQTFLVKLDCKKWCLELMGTIFGEISIDSASENGFSDDANLYHAVVILR